MGQSGAQMGLLWAQMDQVGAQMDQVGAQMGYFGLKWVNLGTNGSPWVQIGKYHLGQKKRIIFLPTIVF